MTRYFTKLLLSAVLLSIYTLADTATSLYWYASVEKAFTQAQNEHKNVMVMVEDPHCRWCVKMKTDTLSDARVEKMMQEYILLKIDRSDTKTMESLPGLRGPIPSFHFFTPKRVFIDKVAGYYQADDFLGYLQEITNDDK